MKTFKNILSEVAQPKSSEEKAFKDLHNQKPGQHPVAPDDQFSGDIGKPKAVRKADNTPEKADAEYDTAYGDKPDQEPVLRKGRKFSQFRANESKEMSNMKALDKASETTPEGKKKVSLAKAPWEKDKNEDVNEGIIGNMLNKRKAAKQLNTALDYHNKREAEHKDDAEHKAKMPTGGKDKYSASTKRFIKRKVKFSNDEAKHHAKAAGHLNDALKANKDGDHAGVKSAMKAYHKHHKIKMGVHHDLPHTSDKTGTYGGTYKEDVNEGIAGNLVKKVMGHKVRKNLKTAIDHHDKQAANHQAEADHLTRAHKEKPKGKVYDYDKPEHAEYMAGVKHNKDAANHLHNALKAHEAGNKKDLATHMQSYHKLNKHNFGRKAPHATLSKAHYGLPHTGEHDGRYHQHPKGVTEDLSDKVSDIAFGKWNEALSGGQKKLDHNKNGKIDGHDFAIMRAKGKKKTEVAETTSSAMKHGVTQTGPDGKTRTVFKKTRTDQTDDRGQDIIRRESFSEMLDEAVKVGNMRLKNGKNVKVSKQDAKLLNDFYKNLNAKNRRDMSKVMMKDEAGFKEIVGFAREAL